MTQELITITADGMPVIDSLTIAEGCQVQHKNVIELIRKYLPDFQAFGAVAFETRKGKALPQGGFAKATEVALLNEDQATLLFTYLKNSEIARSLKIRVVKAFRDCRNELAKAKATPPLPDYSNLPKIQILRMAIESEEQRIAAEKKNEELMKRLQLVAPKEEAYDALIDDKGTYNATAVAKILHMKRCDLFTWFKSNQVAYLQKDGWLPYSTWEKKQWALVKITEGNNKKTGEPFTSQRLRFTVAGIFQMHKMMQAQKINVPEQLNLNLEGATA